MLYDCMMLDAGNSLAVWMLQAEPFPEEIEYLGRTYIKHRPFGYATMLYIQSGVA